uniref:Transmembrane protein 230 n=1 Tax=Elaeis guineensis var. tenera TaxID=51953 RepID=A0A8N4FDH7_ELAGV|nr:transmembrane protein 230 [Elaeis guineensis]
MTSRRHVRYQPLAADERDSDSSGEEKDVDLRYLYIPKSCKKIPWKSIALALFLLALGSALLFLSFFVFTGHMAGDQSQAYAFLLLGILAFLPGFYETRVAYYSWRGAQGYTFASIPDY